MSDRTQDWNALYDPATEAGELRRIAAEHPEFAEQAGRHVNWVAVVEVAPPPPPVPSPTPASAPIQPPPPGYAAAPPAPVYMAPAPQRSFGARLTGGERAWWLVVGLVWLLSYASAVLLPAFGVELTNARTIDEYLTQLLWITIGFEAVPFALAIVAALVVGRGSGRKLGAALVLVVGLALLGLGLYLVFPLQYLLSFSVPVGGEVVAQLLGALYAAGPVGIEIVAGVIAYTIAGRRRWLTLLAIPIGFALLYGAYFLAVLLEQRLPLETAFLITVGAGVLVRLIVILLAGAFGARREPLQPYAAPVYASPRA